MKIKSALTTFYFLTIWLTCFSQNDISSVKDTTNLTSLSADYDLIKINDSTFQCVKKIDDVGLAFFEHEEYLQVFGKFRKGTTIIKVSYKSEKESKPKWFFKNISNQIKFIDSLRVFDKTYYKNKLSSVDSFDVSGGQHKIYYSNNLFKPHIYKTIIESDTMDIVTETEYYSKTRIKSITVRDKVKYKAKSRTCFDIFGRTKKCRPEPRYL